MTDEQLIKEFKRWLNAGRPKEWYEDPEMIGKPVWVRDRGTHNWKVRIFEGYNDDKYITSEYIEWKYAKPVKPEDLYQGAQDDR